LFIRKHRPWLIIPGTAMAVVYALMYLFAGSVDNFKIAMRGILAGLAGENGPVNCSYNKNLRTIINKLLAAFYRKTKLTASLAYFCVQAAWHAVVRIAGFTVRPRLTIIYYHGVPTKYRFEFARQMDELARTSHVVAANFDGKLPAGKNNVAVTFEDAFESVARNAVPELARRSFQATIFVPVDVIGRTPDWRTDRSSVIFEEPVMTAAGLKALPSTLVTLGSHTLSHPQLSQLDAGQAQFEIDSSRHKLVEIIERDVDLFAFPYGDYNESVVKMCKSAGYSHVFTIIPAHIDTEENDFVRGRVKVDPWDSPLEFFLKSHGAYVWIPAVRSWVRRLLGRH
jgi:peptidoglycan/xylan/chitin deacetylase (PgdA/CDA1 family)